MPHRLHFSVEPFQGRTARAACKVLFENCATPEPQSSSEYHANLDSGQYYPRKEEARSLCQSPSSDPLVAIEALFFLSIFLEFSELLFLMNFGF